MQPFLRLLYKDILVIIRDRAGLAMMFLMPVALVLIMTSLQDTTFRVLNEKGIRLLLLNLDADSLGATIERELSGSELFRVYNNIEGETPSPDQVNEAVALGKYQIGMIIPANATERIREQVKRNITSVLSGEKITAGVDSVFIQIYLDPTTKESFRESLQISIRDFSARIESRIVLSEITSVINDLLMTEVSDLSSIQTEPVFYREEYAMRGNSKSIPNSAQHNVPAWTILAMFFVVIPFAGAMIREREEGSLARLLTMPCPYISILLSRAMVYLVICILQFAVILIMGIYLFPHINLPALVIEGSLGVLAILAAVTSMAAIGYGIAIGTIARTHTQASVFAAISVVILAALGGVWVPVFIMPPC
jgi:ABC-2 type transport system permease protein